MTVTVEPCPDPRKSFNRYRVETLRREMYDELIYHLDLCILAFQLHSQTLIRSNSRRCGAAATKSAQGMGFHTAS